MIRALPNNREHNRFNARNAQIGSFGASHRYCPNRARSIQDIPHNVYRMLEKI